MSFDDLYPEHVKLGKIADQSQAIGEFVDWLGEKGLVLARFGDGVELSEDRLYPASYSIQKLLAEHFGIDQDVLEREKRAMLEVMMGGHS